MKAISTNQISSAMRQHHRGLSYFLSTRSEKAIRENDKYYFKSGDKELRFWKVSGRISESKEPTTFPVAEYLGCRVYTHSGKFGTVIRLINSTYLKPLVVQVDGANHETYYHLNQVEIF